MQTGVGKVKEIFANYFANKKLIGNIPKYVDSFEPNLYPERCYPNKFVVFRPTGEDEPTDVENRIFKDSITTLVGKVYTRCLQDAQSQGFHVIWRKVYTAC